MKINLNDSVRVRLTEHGRRLHREHWNEKVGDAYPYQQPQEDEDGWSTWQLWELMATFGEHLCMCCKLPFKTQIETVDCASVTERKRATTDPKPCDMTSSGNRAPQTKRAGS